MRACGESENILGEQLVNLLFGGVERQIAHVEGCRVLQLVLRIRRGPPLVIIAAPSALLEKHVSVRCRPGPVLSMRVPWLWHTNSVCPSARWYSSRFLTPALWCVFSRSWAVDMRDSNETIVERLARGCWCSEGCCGCGDGELQDPRSCAKPLHAPKLSFIASSSGAFCMRAATSISRPPTLPNSPYVISLGRCS